MTVACAVASCLVHLFDHARTTTRSQRMAKRLAMVGDGEEADADSDGGRRQHKKGIRHRFGRRSKRAKASAEETHELEAHSDEHDPGSGDGLPPVLLDILGDGPASGGKRGQQGEGHTSSSSENPREKSGASAPSGTPALPDESDKPGTVICDV